MILQITDIKDIGELIEPEKLEMTYDTPGWYVVLFVSILLVLFVVYKLISNWKKNKYRRDAVADIKNSQTVDEVSEKLKIVAIKSYGRSEVANLSSYAWVDFLNTKSKVKFQKEIFEFIYSEKEIESKVFEEFKQEAIRWVKDHG